MSDVYKGRFFGEAREVRSVNRAPASWDKVDDVQAGFDDLERRARGEARTAAEYPEYEDMFTGVPEPEMDPASLAQFKADMQDPRLLSMLDSKRIRSSAAPRPDPPTGAAVASVVPPVSHLHREMARIMRAKREAHVYFSSQYLRHVPDAYRDAFVRYLEVDGALKELLPLLRARGAHMPVSRLTRALCEAGAVINSVKGRDVPGHVRDQAECDFPDEAHAHFCARRRTTPLFVLCYNLQELYDAADAPKDDDDSEEDSEESAGAALRRNCDYSLYVVAHRLGGEADVAGDALDRVCAGVLESSKAAAVAGVTVAGQAVAPTVTVAVDPVVCFRTFYFAVDDPNA